jgi:hypothetical protein
MSEDATSQRVLLWDVREKLSERRGQKPGLTVPRSTVMKDSLKN